MFFLNKSIWTRWCFFHESAEKVRQNITNFHSIRVNVFSSDFISSKKAFPAGPFESVKPTCDRRADFFEQNYIVCSNFWKSSAQILREKTKLLEFCSEKKKSPGKVFFRQINPIFDNHLEIHCQSTTIFREGSEKNSFVCFCSSKRSFGNRDAFFINMPKKNNKKVKIQWIFSQKHVVPQKDTKEA